jgi:predicted neuraminidase
MKIEHREFLKSDTPSVHAATIAFYKGKPVFSWFGGSREGMPDVAIYVQAGDKIHVIGDKDQIPRWNPILFPYKDKLYLFIKGGLFCDRWWTNIYDISNILNDDFDIEKVGYQLLPAGLNACVKTKPIVRPLMAHKDLIYCGSSVETMINWSSFIETYVIKNGLFEFLDRNSPLTVPVKTYEDPYYGKRNTMGIIQPSLWDDGENLHAFFRSSRGLGKIYYSKSYKNSMGGINWVDPEPTKFNNPNSGIDCVFFNDKLFLAYNPSSEFRHPLVISELDPSSLEILNTLVIREEVDKKDGGSFELSYPFLIENNGQLNLVYTYSRVKIEYCVISI